MPEDKKTKEDNACPKCGSILGEVVTTPTGKKLQRCSKGSWDSEARKNVGCEYVLWLPLEPEELDEKCPKCGSTVMLVITRFGKKMKRCSKNVWNKDEKKATGCDYIEWISGTKEELDEECPNCGEKLILYTTASGKKMKKCSTSGWDPKTKKATGCTYVYWFKKGEYDASNDSGGEEFLPPEPKD